MDSVWTSYLAADKAGARMDSARGYLQPVLDTCTNLQLIQGATVTKIVMNGNTTVSGVIYQMGVDGEPQVPRNICPFL